MKLRKPVLIPPGLGARIKAARLERKMTLEQLARQVGVSKSAVQQWESGNTENLKLQNLFSLGIALGKDVYEICFGANRSDWIREQAPAYAPQVSADEIDLVDLWRRIPPGARKGLKLHLRNIASDAPSS